MTARQKVDYRNLAASASHSFTELLKNERFLNERIEELKKNEREYEMTKNHLLEEIKLLRIKEMEMQERVNSGSYSIPPKLCKAQHQFRNPDENTILLMFHKEVVIRVLHCLEKDLKNNLKCLFIEGTDANMKETYQVYGLLLSACTLKKREPNTKVIDTVLKLYSQQPFLKDNVDKAVTLTHDMLTLLPPLVVTVYPEEYKEELHDTNRLTWDESGGSHKLIYYRPILVYGNQLRVAMKGLVGNSKKEIKNESQYHQEQQQCQLQQGQQLLHYQQQQQQLQQQEQHQQKTQQKDMRDPSDAMMTQNKYENFSSNLIMSQNSARVAETNNQAVSNTAVSIEGHPDYILGQQSQATCQMVPMCAVCKQPCTEKSHCRAAGPDKVTVHRYCYKCKTCGDTHNLIIYYDEFVCAKHINHLTCKLCRNSGFFRIRGTGFYCSCQESVV